MALPELVMPGVLAAQKPDGPSLTEQEIPKELGGEPSDSSRGPRELAETDVVTLLEGYRLEAEYSRLAGPTSRDRTWLEHWDLYYNRWDFSKKAPWQAREVMPEFPQYVDRFAAAMRMALVANPEFFSISCDNDQEGDLSKIIRKFMDVVLRRIGRNPSGHRVDFSAFFEEAMKMGALSMLAAKVTQREDGEGSSYTAIELVDPYNAWLDPTGRRLYRIHREEMDLHELRALLSETDAKGSPIFDQVAGERAIAEGIQEASAIQAMMRAEREKRTGTGQWYMSTRKPVVLHEYYADLVDNEGYLRAKNCLFIVANNKVLIRGLQPDGEVGEPNPFWHGQDWMVITPIITVPLAPYGRSYAENFAAITRTFNEMMNLTLDGVMATTMKIFSVVPGYMEDPSQLEDGIYPNAMYRLIEGIENEQFMRPIDMGSLDKNAFPMLQFLKKELQEGAAFNDMTLGNSAPNARTSAAEINTVDQNSTSYMRAIANNIETLFLEPLLDLIWKTAIQHLDKKDKELEQAIGPQWFKTFLKMKKQFATYKVTFVCRGITSLLARKAKLQEFLQFLQICAANPQMTQILAQTWPPQKLFAYLSMLMDIDVSQLEATPRDKQIQQAQEQQAKQKAAEANQQEAQKTGQIEAAKEQARQAARTKADIAINAAKEKHHGDQESRLKVLEHLLGVRTEQRAEEKPIRDARLKALMAAHGIQGEPGEAEEGEENGTQTPAG